MNSTLLKKLFIRSLGPLGLDALLRRRYSGVGVIFMLHSVVKTPSDALRDGVSLPRVGVSLVPHSRSIAYVASAISGSRNALMNKFKRVIVE